METDITEDLNREDGQEAVEGNDEKESIKEILSKTLGKDFPSDEAALKAVKDTFSYVGKKKEDIQKELQPQETQIDPSKYVSREEFEEATFYAERPELKPLKPIINALRQSTGKGYDEVVASDDFKSLYSKVEAYDKQEKSKSILQTNPRLGQVKDTMTQARESLKNGDLTKANDSATQAVIDAFEI